MVECAIHICTYVHMIHKYSTVNICTHKYITATIPPSMNMKCMYLIFACACMYNKNTNALWHQAIAGSLTLNPQNINKISTWKGHDYFSFHASFKSPLKASAMAEVRSARIICYT